MKPSYAKSTYAYIVVIVIGIILVGGAVYAKQSGKSNSKGTSTSNTTVIETEKSNKRQAPNFTLNRLKGGTIELASYRGQKPVVLDFFATWCPNCRRDMPHLNGLYEKYKDQVEVIGIDLQEQASLITPFTTDLVITFPIALDSDGKVSQLYGVRYTNFHVLIDKAGNIVGSVPGDINESDITNLIGE